MIVMRLVLRSKNIRKATGGTAGAGGLSKIIVTALVEVSAIYAVKSSIDTHTAPGKVAEQGSCRMRGRYCRLCLMSSVVSQCREGSPSNRAVLRFSQTLWNAVRWPAQLGSACADFTRFLHSRRLIIILCDPQTSLSPLCIKLNIAIGWLSGRRSGSRTHAELL